MRENDATTNRDSGSLHPVAILRLWWADEGCSWKVEHTGYGRDKGEWVVMLEWTTDQTYFHDADWATLTWQFHAADIFDALDDAALWVAQLAPWKPCPECDGHGEWQGKTCTDCEGTGRPHLTLAATNGSSS